MFLNFGLIKGASTHTLIQYYCTKIQTVFSPCHSCHSHRICTHSPQNEPEMICLSPGWLLAVSHPNQKGRVVGGHVWPPLRRITGSLSAPQTTNGSPLSLWQQPRTLEDPQTGASKQMPIINVAIRRCQSCQSALHGGRPSPRPVRGP